MSTSLEQPVCNRRNHVHAAYVSAAIKIKDELGVRRAEEFLIREGVPRSVIARVLLTDGLCRVRSQ